MDQNCLQPGKDNASLRRLLAAWIVLLSVVYLIQALSPLRINTDSYRLLSMAVSAHQGQGFLVDGKADQFPPAYPWIIKSMLQLGIANSHSLVLLNLLSLAIGLGVLYHWCLQALSRSWSMLVMIFVLSSWVLVKHITIPLTDTVYMGLSMLTVHLMCLFCRAKGICKWGWYAASVLLTGMALMCRTTGVALLPVLGMCLLIHPEHARLTGRLVKHQGKLIIGLAVLVLLGIYPMNLLIQSAWFKSQFMDSSSYFQNLIVAIERDGLLMHMVHTLKFRLIEMGEIFCNVPWTRLPHLSPVFYAAGVLTWLLLIRGSFVLLRHPMLRPVSWYMLSYTCMMLCWPYFDARFWIPMLPVIGLMMWVALSQIQVRLPRLRFAIGAYMLGVVGLGVVALIFSTRISLAGRQFSEVYGNGSAKMTYRYALDNGLPVEMDQVMMREVRLLQIFEPLAKPENMLDIRDRPMIQE